jgi:hypothetical protein
LVKGEDVLGFNEVGNFSLTFDTSPYKAAPWTAHILFWDQSKVKFLQSIYLEGLDKEIAEDAGDFEGGEFPVFKFLQELIVKDELRDVVHAIRIFHGQVCDHTFLSHAIASKLSLMVPCMFFFA